MRILILMAFFGAFLGITLGNPPSTEIINETQYSTSFKNKQINKLDEVEESISEEIYDRKHPRNCMDLYKRGNTKNRVYRIYPYPCCEHKAIQVYCDMVTDGGGWTVIQRRDDLRDRENFYRTWMQYVLGFGNLKKEFWLGLDHIHALTDDTLNEVRFELEDYEGEKRHAKYSFFHVDDRSHGYKLEVEGYSGDAGDSMLHSNHMKFSTKDVDNDNAASQNCAKLYHGAWWYESCHNSNLNGKNLEGINSSYGKGIIWRHFRGHNYSLKKAEIKIRPAFYIKE